jgi:hypothetical protein
MNKVRESKDQESIAQGKKVGSGKNWTHRVTVPKEPTLSYKNQRGRKADKHAMGREVSKELQKRNLSLEQINTKDYIKEGDFA